MVFLEVPRQVKQYGTPKILVYHIALPCLSHSIRNIYGSNWGTVTHMKVSEYWGTPGHKPSSYLGTPMAMETSYGP